MYIWDMVISYLDFDNGQLTLILPRYSHFNRHLLNFGYDFLHICKNFMCLEIVVLFNVETAQYAWYHKFSYSVLLHRKGFNILLDEYIDLLKRWMNYCLLLWFMRILLWSIVVASKVYRVILLMTLRHDILSWSNNNCLDWFQI